MREIKRSKSIAIGAMIFALVVLPLFSAYSAEKQLPAGALPKIITQPPQATKQIKQLPDLIVERVWLDKEGFINFQLKNSGQGEILDSDHRQGMVRVTFGNEYEDFSFTRTLKTKPPVDPKGLLKKPNGVVLYNTGIKVKERLTVKVVVDSLAKITEANDQNNQGTLLAPAVGALKAKGKEVQPVSPEVGRGIAQKEEAKTRGGKGPGGGGGGLELEISGFAILHGPTTGGVYLSLARWGATATYTFNGGGAHENIKFRVRVRNLGPGDFYGAIAITVYPITSPGPSPVGITTPYIRIPAGTKSDYFEVVLRQSEQIAQGKLSPGGRYEFMAKIKYLDGTDWETATSNNRVTLTLTRPHPVVQAIQETMTLTSEPSLSGTIHYNGRVETADIEVGGGCYKRRGFISFDLSPLQEKIDQWKSEGLEFEIKSATLTLYEYSCGYNIDSWDSPERVHEYIGRILFDYLEYGDGLDSSDYNAPFNNLFSFQSALDIHTLNNLDAYVRFQLEHREEAHKIRIQFRLRLANEDHDAYATFRKPCQLMVVIKPKR